MNISTLVNQTFAIFTTRVLVLNHGNLKSFEVMYDYVRSYEVILYFTYQTLILKLAKLTNEIVVTLADGSFSAITTF